MKNANMLNKKKSSSHTKTLAIIPAAGAGVRMGTDRAKQFLNIDGKPLLAITLKHFQVCRAIDAIIVVVPLKDVDFCREDIVKRLKLDKVKKVVAGGERRQDSVRLGLEAADVNYDLAIVHDGVRPIISKEFIERLINAAKDHGAVAAGLPAKETLKEVDDRQNVVNTYNRGRVWLVQTPQIFPFEDILAAHRKAFHEDWAEATDDSLLFERLGLPVRMVKGSEQNIKVTTPNDLELAAFFLNRNSKF